MNIPKLILCFALLLPITGFGAQFNSSFLNFDLPNGWSCKHIAGSWNCSNPNNSKTKGLIVVTTKKTKIGTTMQTYKAKLMQPKKTTWNNKVILSEPQSVEEITIRGQKWIQATHLNGEIPNNVTKYLITIKSGLSILVSFTAHNDDYPRLFSRFVKSIESIKVRGGGHGPSQNIAGGGGLASGGDGAGGTASRQNGNGLDNLFEEDHIKNKGSKLTVGSLPKIGALILILLGVAFYIISKKRKK